MRAFLGKSSRRLSLFAALLLACTVASGQENGRPIFGTPRGADEFGEKLERLQQLLERQNERIKELESRLEKAEAKRVSEVTTQPDKDKKGESALDKALREAMQDGKSPLDKAVGELGPITGAAPSLGIGRTAAQTKYIDIAFDLLTAAGGSTRPEPVLRQLQVGGHDPSKRGFTLQNGELTLSGAVDPYFRGQANIILFITPEGETVVELEEAFLETTSLPHDLQLRAGQFFVEFGRLNQRHPHEWLWIDQPIINGRLFGPDGLRSPGIRLSKLLSKLPWYSMVYVGMHNANGETAASFLSDGALVEEGFAPGGRPFQERDVHSVKDLLYSARWEHSWSTHHDEITWALGASGLWGPNYTGGQTYVYGLDLKAKWLPSNNERGWPFVTFESEIMSRSYRTGTFLGSGDPANPTDDVLFGRQTVGDWGLYAQVLWGCKPRWAVGLRYEYAWGHGDNLAFDPDAGTATLVSRQSDFLRCDRHRISPMVVYYPSEFSRLRLQYNYDEANFLEKGDAAHSVWFGFEILFGAHPPHKF